MQIYVQMAINRFYFPIILLCITALLIVACAAPVPLPISPLPAASLLPPAFVAEVTAETLPKLIVAEREASIQGNLSLLATLWSENGRIVDGRGSVEEADDYVWSGRYSILDRYQMAVFPAPPPPLALTELAGATLIVADDSATLINHDDRWRFVWQGGRWWLQELVYSAPLP